MSRWFIATIPIVSGQPVWGPNVAVPTYDGEGNHSGWNPPNGRKIDIDRSGNDFTIRQHPEDLGAERESHALVGRYLGRLGEGKFNTTGRPAVIVCTTSTTKVKQYFLDLAAENGDYRFEPLEQVWKIQNVRDWLKNAGMPWIEGEFGPVPGSGYGRPTLPIVWCGQNHDPFVSTEE